MAMGSLQRNGEGKGRRDTPRGLLMEPSAWMRLEACWYLAAGAECGVQEASSPAPGRCRVWWIPGLGSGTFLESGQLSRQVWPSPNQSGHSGPSPPQWAPLFFSCGIPALCPSGTSLGCARGASELGGFSSCWGQGKR